MPSRRSACAALWLVLAGAGLAALLRAPPSVRADGGGDGGEDVRDPLPWHADPGLALRRRIVDATTGAPIVGAIVKLFAEVPHPESDFGVPTATGTSDAEGWVQIRTADLDPGRLEAFGAPTWAFVEADGYGPDEAYERHVAADPDWPLTPATTMRVGLVDPLGRPIEGALVGWFLGCGHTPDVRQARTGADGVAVLPRVAAGRGGRVWFVRDGFCSTYIEADDVAFPGEAPRWFHASWGATFEGVVLTHDGAPAPGVAVGGRAYHRGPWTHTDAEGRFRLVGSDARPGSRLTVEVGAYPVGPAGELRPGLVAEGVAIAAPAGHRTVVRLPRPDPASEADPVPPPRGADGEGAGDEPRETRLVVEPRRHPDWPNTDEPVAGDVVAVRLDDGFTSTARVGEQDVALVGVLPGRYRVYVTMRRASGATACARGQADVDVPADGAYVAVAVPAPAVLPVLVPDDPVALDVVTEDGDAEVELEDRGRRVELLVEPGRPLALRVRRKTRTILLPIDAGAFDGGSRAPEVELPTMAPVLVRARLLGPDGVAVAGWLLDATASGRPAEGAPSPRPERVVDGGDGLVVVAWPDDDVGLRPRRVEVGTARNGETIDLGDVRLAHRPPPLFVRRADGRPLDGGTVRVTSGARSKVLRIPDRGPSVGRVEDPWEPPGLVVEGAMVRIDADGGPEPEGTRIRHVPTVARLEGPGPWTVRRVATSFTVDLPAPVGAPAAARAAAPGVVVLDGVRYACDGAARLRLVGLAAGRHVAVVEVGGYVPRRLAFTIADGEDRVWTPRLSPRVVDAGR